jgi:hypothetical protein
MNDNDIRTTVNDVEWLLECKSLPIVTEQRTLDRFRNLRLALTGNCLCNIQACYL